MVITTELAAAVPAYRRLPKIVLLGDFGSGKSALFRRLSQGVFTSGGCGFGRGGRGGAQFAAIRLPDGNKAVLHDTCDMERFDRSLTNGYYRGAVCVILVADASNLHSVRSLDYWNTEVQCYAPEASKILVFSKSDSPVADAGLIGGEIESYRARLGCCLSAVVSSKTGHGTDQLLQRIAEARQLHRSREFKNLNGLLMGPKIIRLQEESENQNKSSDLLSTCCT